MGTENSFSTGLALNPTIESGELKSVFSKSRYLNRPPISFRSANCRADPQYSHSSQCHHLLPLQILSLQCFEKMLNIIGCNSIGFHDFRINGLLLPATEKRSAETGLPLHRGPHNRYNEVVIMRVGMIEKEWSRSRKRDSSDANDVARSRIGWLQGALRKRLINECERTQKRTRLVLNRNDPVGTGYDFTELDDMAEILFGATAKRS